MIDPRPLEDRLKPRFWYGWIVLAIVFGVMATLIGVRNSLGFFFTFDLQSECGGRWHVLPNLFQLTPQRPM